MLCARVHACLHYVLHDFWLSGRSSDFTYRTFFPRVSVPIYAALENGTAKIVIIASYHGDGRTHGPVQFSHYVIFFIAIFTVLQLVMLGASTYPIKRRWDVAAYKSKEEVSERETRHRA